MPTLIPQLLVVCPVSLPVVRLATLELSTDGVINPLYHCRHSARYEVRVRLWNRLRHRTCDHQPQSSIPVAFLPGNDYWQFVGTHGSAAKH